ncbi:MAG: hypothetical protein ABI378_14305 [Chitinophagaceae bacterium]
MLRVIANPARRKASVALLRIMVMASIAKPLSKRGSTIMLEHDFGISIHLNQVYRMIDFLDAEAIERAKHLSYTHTQSLLPEPLTVLFYDCTMLYFESFTEDELKQNGYIKDGKFNQSQILLALMVTTSGLPVSNKVFGGSKFEGHTLENTLIQLRETYKIDKVIFAADAALLSKDNIARFRAVG